MLELSTLARPYAHAVFRVAKSSQSIALWAENLALWSAVVEHPDVLACIQNPKLSQAQVLELFALACKGNWQEWPQAHRNFLQTLALHGRLLALPEVQRQFIELKNKDDGCADAVLETAFPLTDLDVAGLKPGLEKHFGVRIQIDVRVKPELIGGIRVLVGDQVMDSSVRGRLQAMHQALLA